MDQIEQRRAAKEFVARWQSEEGNEDRQSRSFWIELVGDVLGVANPTHVLDFERKVRGRKIDVFYEDMGVLIEQKSRGVDLDKKSERSKKAGEETPFQQAKWYADNLPYSLRPRWIIVSNFDETRVHDLDTDDPEADYITIALEELPEQLHLLGFMTDRSESRLVKEQQISVQAGEIVGRLYKSLSAQYKNIDTDPHEQRSLNILIVRLVFLLYAEDAGILQEHQAFLKYMKGVGAAGFRDALIQLFRVLDTPEDKRDPYIGEELAAFPYINGSLFAEDGIVIPQFTEQIRFDLLKETSQEFDWSGISPTIFGAAFESTLNPETRRTGGMHYTSIENIHRVIDPLFLDDLRAELVEIEGIKIEKTRSLKLRQFQEKLASIKVLDPACGSGNFLTESYLSLRRLENRVLENLMGDQLGLGFTGDTNPIKVTISQFHGIEINDFAVAVAKTALWISEEQMMDATQEILFAPLEFLPLSSNDNIVEGDALEIDWADVLPPEECSYIIGNPPFFGASNCNAHQKSQISGLFSGTRLANSLDFVSGWYVKAARYMAANPRVRAALVSTNSITQGEQVAPLWGKLIRDYGVRIDFAWSTFYWSNDSTSPAHVHCVIIGFSVGEPCGGFLFSEGRDAPRRLESFSPYLRDLPLALVPSVAKPLSDVPAMVYGNKPSDDGNLVLSGEEREELLRDYPESQWMIRRLVGAQDYLHGQTRWCLWLLGADSSTIDAIPPVRERVERVRLFRESSSAKDTRKRAEAPHEFFRTPVHDVDYLAVPRTSSERRDYLPIGYFGKDTIPSDATTVIPEANLYLFGILSSSAHMAWLRVVAGRLKSDYRYSGKIVYNNFPWPSPTDDQRLAIEAAAQAVLDARYAHEGDTLADLYDPDKMPGDLRLAHRALDRAVEDAYGVNFNSNEERMTAHLFKLYAELTGGGQ